MEVTSYRYNENRMYFYYFHTFCVVIYYNLSDVFTETPWGSLPILEVDGQVLSQSMAIARFVAREAGLYLENWKKYD